MKHSYLANGKTQASREGWSIFRNDDKCLCIQRLDEGPFEKVIEHHIPIYLRASRRESFRTVWEQNGIERWSDDRYAIAFVRRQARKGSAYHAHALKLVGLKA